MMALLWCVIGMIGLSRATSQLQDEIPADTVRTGCSILFSKQFHIIAEDPLSNPLFDMWMEWRCRDGEAITIDKYEINGASPELEALFFWQENHIVTLVKWSVNSQSSDYVGNYYKIFSYQYERDQNGGAFTRNEDIMKKLPAGLEGRTKNGSRVIYPFKNETAIRKRLRTLKPEN